MRQPSTGGFVLAALAVMAFNLLWMAAVVAVVVLVVKALI